jgi:TetR/AcrR family transcriptional regulator, transcriptional repressor of bet genes
MKRTRAVFTRQLPEDRRKALVEATITSLKQSGHDGLSVRRIAAAAGVSLGLINHHFPSIDELIAEAYRQFSAELVNSLETALTTAPSSPRARLRAFLKASFSPPTLDRDLLNVWIVFWGLHRHSVEIQRVHDEVYGRYIELVRGLLADASKECGKGRFNLRLTAIGLMAMLDGLWLEWCLDPDNFQPKEAVALCESWLDTVCSSP